MRNAEGVPAPPYIMRYTDTMVDDIMSSPSPTTCERMDDPMLLEALLMSQMLDTEGGASTTQCVVSHHPPTA
jgi:hypothetical protein